MKAVPKSLRTWFLVHFVIDVVFAVPLLIAPEFTLSLFGWANIDPITSRVVGAALMGIGLESLLGRNASAEVYRAMLNLKIIWSLSTIFGVGVSLLAGGGPAMGWVFLAIFVLFGAIWIYYRIMLGRGEE